MATKERTVELRVRIDEDLHEELRRKAEEEDRTLQATARHALRVYVRGFGS